MLEQGLTDNYIRELTKEISTIDHNILHKFPIEVYLNDIKSYPELCDYNYISPKLNAIFENIQSEYNDHTLTLYHKLAISCFIKDTVESLRREHMPDSILDLYQEWFERVLKDFSTQPDDYYNYKKDPFLKDLGGCSRRIIPIGGAWIIELSGIGRNFLVSGGPRQFIDALQFALFKMGGFKPFYQIHTVDRYLDGFNQKERDLCYLRICELLELNPRIRGMYAASWLYDPQLENTSPRLAYLRVVPEQNKAKAFRIGTSQSAIRLSTKKSLTRKRLYKEGKYMPTNYIIIWNRKDLLEWADTQAGMGKTA
ncbi:hypothetical protein [Desulfonema magnum]|uniref:Uncharacterized protein n=1 Tax=Desulfonema magnum TaxID=45655 RepID=A0A975GUA8_9BACT|nr:hypothetical protein [Desulfonema magnum]QTA93896.1 Uncharacterized protein dnm_100040 [Desulfonema magnum]